MEYYFLIAFLLSFTTSVQGLSLELYHKSHPNISHHFQYPNYMNDPYAAKVSFTGEYVVHFSVGTPPLKTFAVFDTGSSIFWLQTSTCDRCLPQPPETRYDLSRSSTLERVICNSLECESLFDFGGDCDVVTNTCTYRTRYEDGTNSSGYAATEVITFTNGSTLGNRNVPLKVRLLMGVGTHNFGLFHQGNEVMAAPGVFGMVFSGRFQLYNNFETGKFSYCIPVDRNKVGYLKFGNASEFLGRPVKLVDASAYYELRLTGVSFNDNPLGRGEDEDEDSWEGFTMLVDTGVDTGTPVSRMHGEILEALETELEKLFDESISGNIYSMCWDNLSADDEDVKRMTITLHFAHIDFKLSQAQIWEPEQIISGDNVVELYCINMIERKKFKPGKEKQSILGMIQTTNKNIAFSAAFKQASIEDRNC